MDIDPLSLIAMRCGGDKFGAHVYTPTYHALLGHLRHRPIKLLEIGIGGYGHPRVGGSSLLTWAEYFSYGQIVGLDISEKQLKLPANVTVYQGSQDDPTILERINKDCGPFDIIIDDGSHIVDLTRKSFLYLYPKLTANGIYIVEDTQTSFHEQTGGRSDGRGTMFQVAHAISLAMHQTEGFKPAVAQRFSLAPMPAPVSNPDAIWMEYGACTHSVSVLRNLIVFQRGDNTYPANTSMDFDHPGALRNYQIMEKMAVISPAPRDSLARIDMNIWGRRYNEAAKLAIATAEKHPNELPVLYELRYLMEWAKRPAEHARIQDMILAAEQQSPA